MGLHGPTFLTFMTMKSITFLKVTPCILLEVHGSSVLCLILVRSLGLLFYREDGSIILFLKVGKALAEFVVSHQKQ
jgi:uncharacterized membrane protein